MSSDDTLQVVKKKNEKTQRIVDSMIAYWIVLLIISLGVASIIYLVWLRDVIV